jgi:hypothetical protein
MVPNVDPKELLAYERRIKKSHPGAFAEFHRLNRAKFVLEEAEAAVVLARREVEAAQKAWDKVGEPEKPRELIRARPGVYGRQATPEEAVRLQAFAREYVAEAPKRAADDAKTAKRLMRKYKREVGEK